MTEILTALILIKALEAGAYVAASRLNDWRGGRVRQLVVDFLYWFA